jgi:hypothetical protein
MLQYLHNTDDLSIHNNPESYQGLLDGIRSVRHILIWVGRRIKTIPLQRGGLLSSFEELLDPLTSPKANSEESNPDPKLLLTQIGEELEKVEDAAASTRKGPTNPIKIYIPYAYNDGNSLMEIVRRLTILKRQKWNIIWFSREVVNDKEWENKSEDNLEIDDLIILIVTIDFLNTDFCYSEKLVKAIGRHNDKKAVVLPIIFEKEAYSYLDGTPFAKLQKTPKGGKAVDDPSIAKQDAYTDITEDLKTALNYLRPRV